MTLSTGTTTTILVIAVVMAGILTGLELGTGLAHQTAQVLPEAGWTRMHQAEDSLFRVVIPPAFIVTVLLLALAAVITRGTVRLCFVVAAVCTLIEIVATVVLNVPPQQPGAGRGRQAALRPTGPRYATPGSATTGAGALSAHSASCSPPSAHRSPANPTGEVRHAVTPDRPCAWCSESLTHRVRQEQAPLCHRCRVLHTSRLCDVWVSPCVDHLSDGASRVSERHKQCV